MLDDGGVTARAIVASMTGNATAAMQQLDGTRCNARIELQTDQRVRHAVAVFVDLDVIVDVDGDRLERANS
jgi:hypothetical protein